MANHSLLLIGHHICPYVQRAVIVMDEKNIAYERTDIDLGDKPIWLKSLSPTGKVPVMVINGDRVLFESNVIVEYLDEISPGTLHPTDIATKACHRAWIEFGTDILDCIAQIIYGDKTSEALQISMLKIQGKLRILEDQLVGAQYFVPTKFHLIDVVYGTIFRYFEVLMTLSKTDPFQGLIKIPKWRNALMKRKSIQEAVPQNYNDLLMDFIQKRDGFLAQQCMRYRSIQEA